MTFTTTSKHDPDGIDIDNNLEDTMTTEEKKKVRKYKCLCTKVNGKRIIGERNLCPVNHRNPTPPETGREWEATWDKKCEDWFFGFTPDGEENYYLSECNKETMEEVKSFIRSIESSALAQGEKIGAEKERARLSGWLMHDDNCKGLYFDPKKTSKCNCGLADALKG